MNDLIKVQKTNINGADINSVNSRDIYKDILFDSNLSKTHSEFIENLLYKYQNIISEQDIEKNMNIHYIKACMSMAKEISYLFEDMYKSMSLNYLKDFDYLKENKDKIIFTLGTDAYYTFEKMLCSTIPSQERQSNEINYQKKVVSNFKKIFPTFKLIKKEYKLSDGDKIDILAKCMDTKKYVIIELKIGNKSGRKQLRSYATHFENPILINISEKEVNNKTNDILYKTYKELGICYDGDK